MRWIVKDRLWQYLMVTAVLLGVAVPSHATDEVLRYNGATGAFIDAFVSSGSGGLDEPLDLDFGFDGNLYVATAQPAIPIPTVSEWGLIVMGLLLLTAMFVAIRRRTQSM